MTTEIIGNWAGAVWEVLNQKGALTVKEIKKETKLREKDIYAALGWLAREDKLKFTELPESNDAAVELA